MDPAVENNLRKREIYDLLDHAVNFGFYDLIKEIDRAILEEFGEIEVDWLGAEWLPDLIIIIRSYLEQKE